MELTFEWDEEKDAENLVKHGLSFKEATLAFFDTFNVTIPDPDHSIEEERFLLLGFGSRQLLVVSFTERKSGIRIISCRKADIKERKFYERNNRR